MATNMNDIREYPTEDDNGKTITGKIRGAVRQHNTPSGNPQWLVGVAYRNGSHLTTASFYVGGDSAVGYDIENYINDGGDKGADVVVSITGGKITKIEKVGA